MRRTRSSCINGWSSRLVNTSWKWKCVYWSTYLQVPRLQDQWGPWLQRRVLLRPTSSSPCCWRSTAPSVKLHAPSAASCSPWSVDLLIVRATESCCAVRQVAWKGIHSLSYCISYSNVLFSQENEHLQKFQVTWELHNKHLFENLVFSEPILHSSLPALVAQLK